jgi:hypothetical protein
MKDWQRHKYKRALYRACKMYVERYESGRPDYNTFQRILKICRILHESGWKQERYFDD